MGIDSYDLIDLIEEDNESESDHFVYDFIIFYGALIYSRDISIWAKLNN